MTTAPAAPAPRTYLRIEFAKRHPLDVVKVAFLLVPTDLLADLGPEEVAEAVFVATNAPFDVDGLAGEVRARLAARGPHRSLSVGDYVRAGKGPTVKVEPVGFSRVAS